MRVSEDSLAEIKKRSSKFCSMTDFILSAVESFDNPSIKEAEDSRKRLNEFYIKNEPILANVGENLNRAMRQVNEASSAGYPTQALILNNLMPSIDECYAFLINMRKELLDINKKTVRK